MTELSFFRPGLLFSVCAVAACIAGCNFSPGARPPTIIGDSGTYQPQPDSGVIALDAGLIPAAACSILNEHRCDYLARCGLIENTVSTRQNCIHAFEATWCGPQTWPSRVNKGTLRFDPQQAQVCANTFLTQACGDWNELADSCLHFLQPRVLLGQDCYDGFVECTQGVCRGSACPRTCQLQAMADEVCLSDAECRVGLYCRRSPFNPDIGLCANYGAEGASCEAGQECMSGLTCISKQCRALPLLGAPCLSGLCAQGFCDVSFDGGICTARKTQGEPCKSGQCSDPYLCDVQSETCVPLLVEEGESCSLQQQCTQGLICFGVSARVPGQCQVPHSEGASCHLSSECESHLVCLGADGGTCHERNSTGLACTSDEDCQTDALCIDSICTALPLPGQSCTNTNACLWGLCRELANVDGGALCGLLLSPGQSCKQSSECASGMCKRGTCAARCVP